MRTLQPIAFAAAALALSGTSLFAGQAMASGITDTSNSVFVGGTPIYTVRVGGGGYTPEERADAIQQRVNECLGIGPIYPQDVTIEQFGGEYTVNVKGRLVFTADSATARYNQSTPHELAHIWATHLRHVLPELTEPK